MTSPENAPERRVGEAVELHLSGVRYVRNVHGDWLNAVYPELPVHPATREALDKLALLAAEVERLREVMEFHAYWAERANLSGLASNLRAAINPLPTPARNDFDVASRAYVEGLRDGADDARFLASRLPTPAPEARNG